MQQTNRSRHRHITSFQVISLGFLSVILLGSLLLMLPIATKSGQCTSFLDALFTATSAVCVTGLVVNDTATYWSLFGQGVILLLIQIGGMGIITIAIAIAVVSGRKIGLMQRSTMQEAISAPTVGGDCTENTIYYSDYYSYRNHWCGSFSPCFLQGLWVLERNMVFTVPFYFCFLQCRI